MSTHPQDSRLKKGPGRVREGRALRNRAATANRELTDSERRDLFRQSFFQSHLPDLPPIDGYHTCWLTTSNVQDPIHGRIRMGYELLVADELPGWEHCKQVTGSYPGCIMVNEMIAAKLRLELYNDYMTVNHHERPLEEASKMSRMAQESTEALRDVGGRVTATAGAQEMAKDPGAPDFGRMYGESGEPYAPHEMRMLRRQQGTALQDDFVEELGETP